MGTGTYLGAKALPIPHCYRFCCGCCFVVFVSSLRLLLLGLRFNSLLLLLLVLSCCLCARASSLGQPARGSCHTLAVVSSSWFFAVFVSLLMRLLLLPRLLQMLQLLLLLPRYGTAIASLPLPPRYCYFLNTAQLDQMPNYRCWLIAVVASLQ